MQHQTIPQMVGFDFITNFSNTPNTNSGFGTQYKIKYSLAFPSWNSAYQNVYETTNVYLSSISRISQTYIQTNSGLDAVIPWTASRSREESCIYQPATPRSGFVNGVWTPGNPNPGLRAFDASTCIWTFGNENRQNDTEFGSSIRIGNYYLGPPNYSSNLSHLHS